VWNWSARAHTSTRFFSDLSRVQPIPRRTAYGRGTSRNTAEIISYFVLTHFQNPNSHKFQNSNFQNPKIEKPCGNWRKNLNYENFATFQNQLHKKLRFHNS